MSRQQSHRQKRFEEGWKRVDGLLDPKHAAIWERLLPDFEGPSELIRAALDALNGRGTAAVTGGPSRPDAPAPAATVAVRQTRQVVRVTSKPPSNVVAVPPDRRQSVVMVVEPSRPRALHKTKGK